MSPQLELLHQPPLAQARNAPALLFVHGAFCAAWCWQVNFMPWFAARGFDCWALSLEGHGASDGHDYLDAISIGDYRNNLSRTIDEFAVPPVVVAHSMGGLVLQQYLQHESLPGAAFLASVPPQGMAANSLRMMTSEPGLLRALNGFQNGCYLPDMRELRELLFSPDTPDALVAGHAERYQHESQRAVLDMSLINPFAIGKPRPVPALVLGAANDALLTPADTLATARWLSTEAEFMPGIGHMMMLDSRWQQVAEHLFAWLQTLGY